VQQRILPPAEEGTYDLIESLKAYCSYLQSVVKRSETLSGGSAIAELRARLLEVSGKVGAPRLQWAATALA
jgi:hypothetical protein